MRSDGGVCFAGGKLSVYPNRQVFQVHALCVVVVEHIGHYFGYSFAVVLLHQQHPLVDD